MTIRLMGTGSHYGDARSLFEAHCHAKPVSTFAEWAFPSRVFPARRGMTAPSFMDLALKAAENAAKSGEVPVGCVIVRDNAVIASAANRTLTDRDPTAHAEMLRSGRPRGWWPASGWSIATSMSHWSRAPCARRRFPWRG